MRSFIIKSNNFLRIDTQGYYHAEYHPGGAWRNAGTIENIICTLKNDITPYTEDVLQNACCRLRNILMQDLSQIYELSGKEKLLVCVVPRAKVNYKPNQLYFKKTVSEVTRNIAGFIDGTEYIVRVRDTQTTHLARCGYGGNGDMPYPGITRNTCEISAEISRKDILLIDDLYTKTINVDEDAIQALYDYGANSVIFYSIGYTVRDY